MTPPRQKARLTDRPFPSYAFLPGRNPHPTRDPRGHSFARVQKKESRLSAYLYGVDLFHYGFYWEAHEAWEDLWKTEDRESETAILLQGLIQFAAALLKVRLGSPEGALKLLLRARTKVENAGLREGAEWMGLDLEKLMAEIAGAQTSIESSAEVSPILPIV